MSKKMYAIRGRHGSHGSWLYYTAGGTMSSIVDQAKLLPIGSVLVALAKVRDDFPAYYQIEKIEAEELPSNYQSEIERLRKIEHAARTWVEQQFACTATPEHWNDLCRSLGIPAPKEGA